MVERRDGDRFSRFKPSQIERQNRLVETIAAVLSNRQPLPTGMHGTNGIRSTGGKLLAPVATNANDLKPTRSVDLSKPVVATIDLPLVDIPVAGAETAAPPLPTTTVASETVTPDTTPVPTTASDAADSFIP